MKLVFFSDIHGNKYAFEEFLKLEEVQKADLIIFAGDIFGYYYYQNEILDKMRALKHFKAILGNHDKMFLDLLEDKIDREILIQKYGNTYRDCDMKVSKENIIFLKSLPNSLVLDVSGHKIAVFHGSPEDPIKGRVYPDTDISNAEEYLDFDYIILGHTHHKMMRKVGRTTVINPGSLGQQRDGKGCSGVLIDLGKEEVRYLLVDYDAAQLIEDIDTFDNGNDKLKEVLLRKVK